VTVPPAKQCTLPDCEREAVYLERRGALCQTYREGLDRDRE